MDTTTILPNVRQDHHLSTPNNPLKPMIKATKTHEPLSSKLKCVRKKRNVGKKDRQSKIHTAQGLRDRRMRLSVHTARKFFDLNDMLGFDKASKTIEWLFSKSREAIEEVTETLQSQAAAAAAGPTASRENNDTGSPFSACETTESVMEVVAAAEKDESLNLHGDQIDQDESLLIKNLGKTKQLFQADTSVDFHQSQVGFQENLDDHNMKESSCYPLEFSNTYHFLKHLHLDNTVRNVDCTYMGNVTSISSINHSIFDYSKSISEPPACWLNSRNPLLGFIGGWNSENPRMEPNNRIMPLNGNMNRDDSCSALMSSNFINFHSENRGQ